MTTEKKPVRADARLAPAAPEAVTYRASRFDDQVAAVTIKTDREGRVTAWSPGAEQVFGWSAHEMLGASADCLFTPQDLAKHRAANEMQCALETGRADDERWHLRKGGARFWGYSEMLLLRDAGGTHCGFVKCVRDITREREVVEGQRADAAFLRSVLAASGDCIKVLDLDANLTFMSERGQRLMEVSDFNAIRGCAWFDFWHDAGNTQARAALAAARAGGLGHFVALGSTLAGTSKWWDVQVTPILGANGLPERLLSVSRDITEARLADAAAQDASSLNTLILNSSRDSIVVLDLEGRTRSISPGGVEGLEIDDVSALIGRSFVRAWSGAEQDAARAALAEARAGGTGRFEGLCATHKGTPKWWDVVISALPGAADRDDRFVAIGRDISEARHAAQLLAVVEDRLAVALSASGVVGTWDWDLVTDLVYGDANYARIYAFDADLAATGAPLAEYLKAILPQDLPGVQSAIDSALGDGAPFSSEYRIVHPNASIRWISARGRVVLDAQGAPARFAGTSVDITEQKSAEQRQAFLLRLSDRLRSLPEPLAVLAATAEELGQHLRASRVGFGQIQADDATVAFQGGYADGVEPIVGSAPVLHFGAGNIARMRRGLTVVCDDVAADLANNPANWAALSVGSFVAVPLIRDGRFRAALYVHAVAPRRWSSGDVALMEDVAARAWDALERARAEHELRVSETRLLTAVAITSLGTFEWDTGTNAVTLSARGRLIFGFSPAEELHADDLFGRIHPHDVERVRAEAAASVANVVPLETTYRVVLPGGAVRWVRSVNEAAPMVAGQALRMVGVFEDVTDRVLAEQTLRTSESQFRMLAQSVPHHVWTASRVGQMEWFNDRAYAYCGVPDGTLEGADWARAVHPDDLTKAMQLWEEASARGADFEAEVRLKRADEVYRWHVTRAAVVLGPDGQVVRWVGTTTDIEELHLAREALADRNVTLEMRVAQQARERDLAWKNSRDLQVIIGADGIIRAANDAWTSMLGWQPDEVVGHHHLEFSHADVQLADRGALAASLAEGLTAYESRNLHKDGGYRWVSWNSTPDNSLVYASGRHITAEKLAAADLQAAQDQLRQSQKMEAVGQLTGGVAHDFNNLLQVISANLQLMGKHAAGNEKIEQRLAGAQDAVRRGAKLAAQLLAFSRRQALEPKVVNVGRFVLAMEDLVRRAIGEAIEIEIQIDTGLSNAPWNALIDPTQIENAVLNLAINARDAMKGNGKLTMTTSNVSLDAAFAKSRVDLQPGDYVRLAVSDTGSGMSPEVMAQVFEPFFSTKPVGSGTGLGLSMVYGFVKQSGGHVEARSQLGVGTTMELYLPRTERVEDTLLLTDGGPVVGGSETILVAEDDEGVRATVVELLLELGYRVLKAKDATSALTVIESGVPIDLLFTDVVMPGTLKSLELARIARQRLPGIAVLFTSGYTQNVITYGDRVEERVELLPKPYTREALARRLRQVLTRQALAGAATPSATAPGNGLAASAGEAGALRVLLVEHNERIRSSTTELLQELGHTVAGAGSAEEAMAMLHRRRIDVLMTDLGLPGMSGDVFAAEARAVQAELRIVFATGSALAPHVIGDGITPVLLLKPYDRAGLAAALAAART